MTFPQIIHFVISEAVQFVTPMGLAIEWILAAFSVLLILTLPAMLARPLPAVAHVFRSMAARPRLMIVICGVAPVLLRVLLLPISPVPQPSIHDEFSHLLLADTLAHRRLTNPTPAMWTHFESIHIILKPTYNSMYLPAQGAFLAVGEVLLHQPWAGVELAIALMCAAMYWMFLAWIPKTWALFGVLLAIIKLTLVGFWVNSYLGGSVPAIGGALIVGSLPRLRGTGANSLHALLFGLGAVVLMFSRPFEGCVLTAIVIALMLPALFRRFMATPMQMTRNLLLPSTAILLLGVACLGYYCWRVTGHPVQMPYQVNRNTYGWPENLAFLPPANVVIHDPVLHQMRDLEVSRRGIYNTVPGLLDNLTMRLFDNWAYLVGPILTIPLLASFFRSDRKTRVLLLLLLAMACLNLFQMVLYPYHLAPVVPVLFCLITLGAQKLFEEAKRISESRALYAASFLSLSLLTATALKQFGDQLDVPPSSYWERGYELHRDARAAIIDWLRRRPGKQLVVVRYAPDHPVNQEWVYNGADLQASKIIWARETADQESNLDLLTYYGNREAWLVEADVYPQRVVPYTLATVDSVQIKNCPCMTAH